MRSDVLRGVFPAAATPFLAPDPMAGIDHELLARHAHALVEEGADGIGLFGSTGEAMSCTREERMDALERLVASGFDPANILIGVGAASLKDAAALSNHALSLGVSHQLFMPPFLYKDLDDEGVTAAHLHLFEQVAGADLRLYLYHFPKLSGVPISFSAIKALAAREPVRLAGLKDSTGDREHGLALLEAFPDLAIFPAADELMSEMLQAGAAGTISGATNVAATDAAAVLAAHDRGDPVSMTAAQTRLSAARAALMGAAPFGAIKAAVAKKRDAPSFAAPRPPLRPASAAERANLERAFAEAGL